MNQCQLSQQGEHGWTVVTALLCLDPWEPNLVTSHLSSHSSPVKKNTFFPLNVDSWKFLFKVSLLGPTERLLST